VLAIDLLIYLWYTKNKKMLVLGSKSFILLSIKKE